MSNLKTKKMTPTQLKYQAFAQQRVPARPVFFNCVKAFFVGGTICLFGQILQWFFITYYGFDEVSAGNPTAAVLIMLSALLTGLGVYDHIGQFAGAGSAVPVTGFANTVASASIEHRSEGFVLGVGANMFKLAGPVIAYGVFSAFVVALIKIVIKEVGGM